MRLVAALLLTMVALPAAAQPIILPLQPQRAAEPPPPPPSPVPVAPPQASANQAAQGPTTPGGQPAPSSPAR